MICCRRIQIGSSITKIPSCMPTRPFCPLLPPSQVNNIMVWILLVSAIVVAALEQWIEFGEIQGPPSDDEDVHVQDTDVAESRFA